MKKINAIYTPFVRKNDSASKVMTDVIIALIPCIIMSTLAYGFAPIAVILVSVASAMITEFLFSVIFQKNTNSVGDGSSIVTGILLAFTVGPFTPLYVVAFGGASAVLFGKLLWGGLGRNKFNPALVGREFMTVFFPVIMSSGVIWHNKDILNMQTVDFFEEQFLNSVFFKVSGAIGEYSGFFLLLGGLFLLIRRRISWHIPFGMLLSFTALLFAFSSYNINFSFGGLLLGSIYMATDMPTSASNNMGKFYYGIMTGAVCIACLMGGVINGYFSYAILLMNGFVQPINWIFKPRVWGEKSYAWKRAWQASLLSLIILITTSLVVILHHTDTIKYVIYAFAIYCIIRFIVMRVRKSDFGKII